MNIISMKIVQKYTDSSKIIKTILVKNNNEIQSQLSSFSDIPREYRSLFNEDHFKDNLSIKNLSRHFTEETANKIRAKHEISLDITIEKTSIAQLLLSGESNIQHELFETEYFSIIYNVCKENSYVTSRYKIFEKLDRELYLKFLSELDVEVDFLLNTEKQDVDLSIFKNYVFTSQAAAIFFHEGVGHFLECDYYKISPFQDMSQIISGLSVYENYLIKNDEKDQLNDVIKNDIKLVENGKIINLLSNRFFSNVFDINNSGNAIFCNNPTLVRMRSMCVEAEEEDSVSYLSDENTCFIEEIVNGDMNPLYGYFSIVVLKARNSSGDYYKPFTLHFDIRDYKSYSVRSLGEKEKYTGLCGKLNELVPVKIEVPPILLSLNKRS